MNCEGVCVRFLPCDNIPEINHLGEEKLIWDPHLSTWSLDCVVLRSLGRQNCMAKSVWWSKAVHLPAAEKQRGEMGPRTKYTLIRHTLNDLLLLQAYLQ